MLVLGERHPSVVYRLPRPLVMVLIARARCEGRIVEVMYVECGPFVQVVAIFDQSLPSPDVGFCDGSGIGGTVSGFLDVVQGWFRAAALALWRGWIGRKIAFEAVPS